MQRGGWGSCAPVERMRDVDEAALFPNRGDGVGERNPPRDLAFEKEADHLALLVGLHLLALDHDQVAAARGVGGLERAAEDVVVGDGDRAEAFSLGVVDELGGVDRAVERPRGVHVQVGDDPRAGRRAGRPRGVRRRRRPQPRRAVELALRRPRSLALRLRRAGAPARAARSASSSANRAAAAAASSGCSSTPGGRRDRAAGGLRLEQHAREALDCRARRSPARSAARARDGAVAGRAQVDARRPGRAGSRGGRSAASSAAGRLPARQLAQHPHHAAGDGALVRSQLDDDQLSLGRGREQRRIEARRDHPVVAGEALRGRVARRARRARQRVEAPEQLLALCARGRVREPVRRDEGRDVSASASRSARYESEGSPGSKPCTTS